jgi:hypothetical protein
VLDGLHLFKIDQQTFHNPVHLHSTTIQCSSVQFTASDMSCHILVSGHRVWIDI